jgi:putative endonuclease
MKVLAFFMFYIYIIYSIDSDIFYVGHSSDPWRRLEQHNTNDKSKFTGKYSSWELKAVFKVSEIKGPAEKLEKYIKKQKSKQLLLKLIDEHFVPNGPLAQLVRVPHSRD